MQPQRLCISQELDDSILDDVQIRDLTQVGLTTQQASAFLAEYRLHLNRTGSPVAAQTAHLSSIALADNEVDPDAILSPSVSHQPPPLPPPRRQAPPLPPPRRESCDVPSGQMSITVKFSVVSPSA